MGQNKQLHRLAGIMVAFGAVVVSAAPLTDFTWNLFTGSWSLGSNWTPGGPPGPNDTARIVSGTSTLDVDASLQTLTVDSGARVVMDGHSLSFPGGTGLVDNGAVEAQGSTAITGNLSIGSTGRLDLLSGATMHLGGGTFQNNGILRINTGGGTTSTLVFDNNITLNGTGSIQLLTPFNSLLSSGGGVTVVNGATHVIRGHGIIDAVITNEGTVRADNFNERLTLTGANKINNGTMESGSGILRLENLAVDQGPAGVISATSGFMEFIGACSVTSGTVRGVSGNPVRIQNTLTANDVNFGGTIQLLGGSKLKLVGGSTTNSGTIQVNSNGTTTAFLEAGDDTTLSGSGAVELLTPSNSELNTTASKTLTNAAGHTIRGTGIINARLVNNGSVKSTIFGSTLTLTGNAKTNNGLIEATSGFLKFQDVAVTQGASGEIRTTGSSATYAGNCSVTSGSMTGANPHTIQNTTELSGVTIASQTDLQGGSTLRLTGSCTNNSTIRVNSTASSTAFVEAGNDVTLSGTGAIDLLFPVNSEVTTAPGKTLTNGTNHTIKGRGFIRGSIVNNGTVNANVFGGVLTIEPSGSGFVNNGTLRVSSGNMTINCASSFTNAGLLDIGNGSTVNGGNLRQTQGTLNLTSTLTLGANRVDLQGGVMQGTGTVNGGVTNAAGNVKPGASPGILHVQGSYEQQSNGKLTIEIGGTSVSTQYDRLEVSGTATLGGTLRLEFINGFVPAPANTFTILTSGTRSGTFSNVEIVGFGGAANIVYNATSVVVNFTAVTGQISGTVALGDWSASTAGVSVTFELRQGGSVVDTLPNIPLDGASHYQFTTAQRGTFEITAKASHWLRQKRVGTITITDAGLSGIDFVLTNGDVDDDNEVGIGDYATLSSAFNTFAGDPGFIEAADLNGDEAVDIGDYAILSSNFGMFGDD